MAAIDHHGVGAPDQPGARGDSVWWAWLMSKLPSVVLQCLSIGGFLLIWALMSMLPWAVQLPSPLDVVHSALKVDPAVLLGDMALSTYRVASGFLLAAAVGIPIGILIGYSQVIRDLLFMPIELFRPIPPIAWIPLAVLFFPTVEMTIVFLTYYGAFFPIVYNTVDGVSNIRTTYIRAGKSLGAGEWTLFWHVMLPAALPVIFTGLYVAIGVSWLMVVAGEMIANKGGLGSMTWQSYQTAQYPRIFVGMALIGLLGWLSSMGVRAVSRLVMRWER